MNDEGQATFLDILYSSRSISDMVEFRHFFGIRHDVNQVDDQDSDQGILAHIIRGIRSFKQYGSWFSVLVVVCAEEMLDVRTGIGTIFLAGLLVSSWQDWSDKNERFDRWIEGIAMIWTTSVEADTIVGLVEMSR
jgi:hypothetical protein